MANWEFYGWTGNNSTATDAASALALSSASALAFGGGARSDFQSNISLQSWNTAMHHAIDTASSSTDVCDGTHLWPLTPQVADFTTRSTAALLDGTYIEMVGGTPHHARGIGLRFTHGFDVNVAPVQIWAGTAQTVQTDPQSCYIAICDLTSSQPTWSTVKPSSKLVLRPRGDTATQDHRWSVGIALQPLVVGHNGENAIKVECTYY